MENVYINLKELRKEKNLFIWDYLEEELKRDLISIDDLIGVIEELISENERLKEQQEDERDYYQEYKDYCAENDISLY